MPVLRVGGATSWKIFHVPLEQLTAPFEQFSPFSHRHSALDLRADGRSSFREEGGWNRHRRLPGHANRDPLSALADMKVVLKGGARVEAVQVEFRSVCASA
jgi:hypothetical protein